MKIELNASCCTRRNKALKSYINTLTAGLRYIRTSISA